MQYFTGYAIEKALSIDNVFVISLIFGYFAIPPKYQYRALVWGIVAVLVLRGFMIAIGAALVQEYDWVLLLFGPSWSPRVSRCCSSAKASRTSRRTRGALPVAPHAGHARAPRRTLLRPQARPRDRQARLWATPLFLALAVINVADLVFAVDSVPRSSPSRPTPTSCSRRTSWRSSACALCTSRSPPWCIASST
jgi:tellurite resistance protein TerC